MKNKKIYAIHKGYVKVPVVMQMEALECGAASLAMILAYYKKWIPLEQVRVDCGVSRDGSNAKNILKAARNYGLKAQGFRYEPDTLKLKGSFPCIIHWNFNHFVVLNGFKKNKAMINDPARGKVEVSMDEFDGSFTGICLLFEPDNHFVATGKKKSIFDFMKKKLNGAKAAIAFVVLTTLITSLVNIINPVFSRIFMDRLLTAKNLEWLYPFLFGLIIFCTIRIIAEWINAIYSIKLEGKLAISSNVRYMWHVLRLPMEFYSQRMAGDIAARKNNNEGIAKSFIDTLAPLFLNMVMMFFYLIVMVRYSLILAVIGIAGVLCNLLFNQYITQKRMNIARVMSRDSGKLWSATVSGIEMIESIKSSGAEDGFFERWSGFQASVHTQKIKNTRVNQYLGYIPTLILQIVNVLILVVGIYFIIENQLTVGMLFAFQGFLSSFLLPAQSLLHSGQILQEMRVDMERVEDVLEYPTDVHFDDKSIGSLSYEKLKGKIELRNVTFGYSKLASPLIEDFNMILEPGKKIAFVGSSGCGKSTLSKLITGLYKPWSGEILFDGQPIETIDRHILTSSLAVVDQDITLFEDTISSNIKMWDNSIENFEIILAARDANIHSDILERENGFEYKMMEGGKDFSGGQRQRLEIARVLAQDPTIMIMDEATSALDAKTEFEVVESIQKRGITCIVIAHRLSTIRDCDEIVVLDHGRVVERGKHQDLYAANGLYTSLVSNE